MKKNLLYIANFEMSLPIIGVSVRARKFIEFLSKEYNLHLVNLRGWGHTRGDQEEAKLVDHSHILQNISSVTELDFTRFGHFVFSWSLLRVAEKLMREVRFDIIVADYGTSAIYGYLLSNRFGVPWVYSAHNVEYLRNYSLARYDFKRFFYVPYIYIVERIGCKAGLVVTVSENDAEVFRRWAGNDKILVIPIGFDEKEYHPFYNPLPSTPPVILFYGNYSNLPNLQAINIIFKDILSQVIQRFPNAVFQFVGANPPRGFVHQSVEFTGFVDNLIDYIRRANVVIVPILSGGGMRTKIIESLACGKIVISTPKGAEGIPRYFSNLWIRNIDKFPDAICEVINNPVDTNADDYEKLRKEFAWQNILPKLSTNINQLLEEDD